MNFAGILLGVGAFLIIGIFHPIVIKAEYYWGKRSWPIFAILAVVCFVVSIISSSFYTSAIFGVLSFSLLWSIFELFKQEERVKLGRAKRNPKREYNF